MKIIFIITGLGMGGAETQVCNLADEFTRLGHQILLISLTEKVVKRPIEPSIKIISLNMQKNILGFIKAYNQTKALIRDFQPDLVHSHMVHANLFARLLRLTCKIPLLICTAHSTHEGGLARILAYRLTDNLADIFTNVSFKAVQAFEDQGAAPKRKMIVQYNGIDTNYFSFSQAKRDLIRQELNISTNTILLLSVGRFNAQKDYPNLLKAFAKLNRENIKLAIVGSGELESEIKDLSINLALNQDIFFLGLRTDISALMSAADIFVLSSVYEGFGLVVAEAMSCERVVVATDSGGVKEVIGECGFLVKPCSSDELAQGIINALAEPPELKQKRIENGRQRIIQNYSLKIISQKWLELYEKALHIKKL